MKSAIKNWLATNVMELSTWVGLIMFIREFFSINGSTLMMVLALVLIFVSEVKLNAYVQRKAPSIKRWIESL